MKNYTLIHGDCLASLRNLPDNSIDSIVTDPPAGIGFMGKEWDKDKGGRDSWIQWKTEIARECLRVLKHGGHAFVWALPRTSHWTATAWENAGFEIRDKICHAFGSGFPKSHDISKAIDREAGAVREVVGSYKVTSDFSKHKGSMMSTENSDGQNTIGECNITAPATDAAAQWDGWGTALKPAVEDWWLVRKPIAEKTVAQNVLKYGTGAINIDACRVGVREKIKFTDKKSGRVNSYGNYNYEKSTTPLPAGRFPANLILDDSDEVRECFPETASGAAREGKRGGKGFGNFDDDNSKSMLGYWHGGAGNASRFFKRIIYCAKASKSERNRGCDGLPLGDAPASARSVPAEGRDNALGMPRANHHPTVKPVALMQYLIQMITPLGGTVLDPFMGSGTTGVAAKLLGFGFVGLEREAEYLAIAQARIDNAAPDAPDAPDLFHENQED